jgi:hypothetical protein
MTVVRTVYGLLRFVATWLQQPTLIDVASEISVQTDERAP